MRLELIHFTQNAWEILHTPIIQASTTHLILLGFNGLFGEADETFTKITDLFPNLEMMRLPVICGISDKAIDKLKQRPALTHIELDFTRCIDYNHFIQDSLAFVSAFKHESWNVKLHHTDHLSAMDLIKIFPYFPRLDAIAFNHSTWITNKQLQKISKEMPHLSSVALTDCHAIYDIGLCDMAQSLKKLTSLRLMNCGSISHIGLTTILVNHGSTLTNLELKKLHLDDIAIELLVTKCSSLETLSLSNCTGMQSSDFEQLMKNCTKLKFLNLSDTSISDIELFYIGKYGKNIETLLLNNCKNVNLKGLNNVLNSCPIKTIERLGTPTISKELWEINLKHPNVIVY
jgi:hypothetical protein